jgi:A/G-specific adenine glycosylase
VVDPALVERVQTALLDWYASYGRDLPWRRTRDPYAVLVAEVMLQQTQVERVVPKWQAWLERFPSFSALAAATRADAVRAWQGLGYNLRAVRLHHIAQQVSILHGGQLPRSLDGLLGLKGVGRYTAGAVACFAFEQPVAMVDTNVRRVLGRVFLGGVPASRERLSRLAEEVLPLRAAYAWNQALMDLGATVCRAGRPACLLCPLRELCVALSEAGWQSGSGRRVAEPPALYAARERRAAEQRARRGRVVDALRDLPYGVSIELADLAGRLQPPEPETTLAQLVDRLVADGLVAREQRQPGAGVRLRLAD